MRTFAITKNGVCRIMRTYTLGPDRHPLPERGADAADEVAKWHPSDQAEVTTIREIAEADVPDFNHANPMVGLKDAWRDTGTAIEVDVDAAKLVQVGHVARYHRAAARDMLEREAMGQDVTTEKASLKSIVASADIAPLTTPESIRDYWPAPLERRQGPR